MGFLIVRSSQGGGAVANPISDNRLIDWSSVAGVEGDITHRSTRSGSVIAAYTGTAGTINTALAGASSGTYVELGAGTFNLSTTIELASNVTLRGQGMSTILNFTDTGGSGFFFGSGDVAIIFQGDYDAGGYNGSNEEGGWPAANVKTWNGTDGNSGVYAKGATVLNLASAPTGLSVGDTITMFQTDESSATLPKDGFWASSKTDQSGTTATGVNWQGSGYTYHMQQKARVTNISGSDVTIWPGLLMPTGAFETGNSPKIGWQTGDIRSAGLEDVYVKTTALSATQLSAIQAWQSSNCWVARVAVSPYTGTSGDGDKTQVGIAVRESRNFTVRSCWLDSLAGGGKGSTTSYGIVPIASTFTLIENNIFYHVESPMLHFGHGFGNVYAYNYEIHNGSHEGGAQDHDAGIFLGLREGNIVLKQFNDLFHAPGMMSTHYRNYTFSTAAGFDFQSYARYMNVVGNVIGATSRYQTTSEDGTLYARSGGSAFRLGYNGQNASINNFYNGSPNWGVAHDPQVADTVMRWGNYSVADSADHFTSSEVPSGETYFPNPVPSSNDLPASLMYPDGAPPYFTVNGYGTVQWPPIGPDVTGGDLVGGRVHDLPAQRAYDAASGVITSFDPSDYGT